MLVILTPYRCCEETAAALRIAELAESLDVPVRIVTFDRQRPRVHPDWDNRVFTGRGDGLYRQATGCSVVVDFINDSKLTESVRLVAEHARMISCPVWRKLTQTSLNCVRRAHGVVCGSRAFQKYLSSQEIEVARFCRFHHRPRYNQRDGQISPENLRVAIWADAALLTSASVPFFEVTIRDFLNQIDDLILTLLCPKSMAKSLRNCTAKLTREFGSRWRMQPVGGLAGLPSELASHDWLMCPGGSSDFGWPASLALASGTPVVGVDAPGLSEFVVDGKNGYLLPAVAVPPKGWAGAPAVERDPSWFTTACIRLFGTDRGDLLEMQQADWKLAAKADSFDAFWRTGLVKDKT